MWRLTWKLNGVGNVKPDIANTVADVQFCRHYHTSKHMCCFTTMLTEAAGIYDVSQDV